MKYVGMIWVILNIVTFIIYGVDKYKAKSKKFRIKENTLLLLALVGGGVGASIGMNFFYHKTQHKKFTIGIPVLVVFNMITYGYLVYWLMNR